MFERTVDHHYQDPVDLIWIKAAKDLGLKIERSMETFAAYDGQGTLTISATEDFDADDCLAQMIFHEICHWLVTGRHGYKLEDWGLSNLDDRDLVYEQASHRIQAALSQQWGLRDFMAVTTDWRPYWDALPADPLADGEDPAIPLAQSAHHLSRLEPFHSVLKQALSATAAIADIVRLVAPENSLWRQTHPRHRLGALLSVSSKQTCGQCAWAFVSDDDPDQLRCRQHQQPAGDDQHPVVAADERACRRWEVRFTIDNCGECGACCRQGFDTLDVAADDPFAQKHPELVQLNGDHYRLPRPDGRCVALSGDGKHANYRCRHYDTRPKNCQEFEVGGAACLVARRRVGLSQ